MNQTEPLVPGRSLCRISEKAHYSAGGVEEGRGAGEGGRDEGRQFKTQNKPLSVKASVVR